MHLNLIVAACEGLGIGLNGSLPWKLKGEMKYFARMTKTTRDPDKTNAVVMGRKTWESIPEKFRPLSGRLNVVISRRPDYPLPSGVLLCKSLEDAIENLTARSHKLEIWWLIGGASLYAEAVEKNLANRVYLTEIRKKFECDLFLSGIDFLSDFVELDKVEGVPEGPQREADISYVYKVYQNKKNIKSPPKASITQTE